MNLPHSHHSSESDQHQLLMDPAPDDRGVHNPMLDNEHAAGNIEGGGGYGTIEGGMTVEKNCRQAIPVACKQSG